MDSAVKLGDIKDEILEETEVKVDQTPQVCDS